MCTVLRPPQYHFERLAAYKRNTGANKSSSIDAATVAKCGWAIDGKGELLCESAGFRGCSPDKKGRVAKPVCPEAID